MPGMISCRLLPRELRILSGGDTFVADGILLTDSNCLICETATMLQFSEIYCALKRRVIVLLCFPILFQEGFFSTTSRFYSNVRTELVKIL